MAYSWNTKPQTTGGRATYSWSNPETRVEIDARVNFARDNKPLSFKDEFIRGVNRGYESAETKPKSFKEAFFTPAPAEAAWNTWSDIIKDTANRFGSLVDTFQDEEATKLDKTVAVGSAGLGIVNTIFSPIPAAINMLTPIPGVGHVADKVNQFFGAVQGGSGAAAVSTLNEIPLLTDDQKQKLSPLVEEVAGLVGTIIVGKATGKTFSELKIKTKSLLSDLDSNIQQARKSGAPVSVEQPAPKVLTPAERHRAYAESQGYSPYTDPTQLPVIEMGGKAKSGLPTIQIGETPKKTSMGEYTVEPVKQQYSWSKTAPGELFQPEGGLRFKVEAEKRGMTVDEVPFVERQRNVVQWKNADDYVTKNYDEALKVYRGEVTPPPGILKNAIEGALEKRALETGDMMLIQQLIKSTLGTETARELQTRNRPYSDTNPIIAGREIRNDRMSQMKDSEKIIKKEKEAAGKIKPPSRNEWAEFIKSIEC